MATSALLVIILVMSRNDCPTDSLQDSFGHLSGLQAAQAFSHGLPTCTQVPASPEPLGSNSSSKAPCDNPVEAAFMKCHARGGTNHDPQQCLQCWDPKNQRWGYRGYGLPAPHPPSFPFPGSKLPSEAAPRMVSRVCQGAKEHQLQDVGSHALVGVSTW